MYFVSSMNGEVPYGPEKLSLFNMRNPGFQLYGQLLWSKYCLVQVILEFAILCNNQESDTTQYMFHGIMNTSHNFFKENLAKKSEIEGKQKRRKCSPSKLENLNIAILLKK